ncbi:fatty-acid amide hydrolase 2-B-like [Prorops nasuta]|uniref:fatty-acid amide hydrolase 2-B-like n=1 Tax=Prorops nasuta TaxID=863751 RepID=UPI0034CD994B
MFDKLARLIVRGFFSFVGIFVIPILRLRTLLERKRTVPIIREKLLLLPASELAKRIRERTVTSEEIIRIYVARCKEVNGALNAIVDERFEDALEEARQVDALIRSNVKTQEQLAKETPLLGVPITVKESIALKGLSHNVGVKRKTRAIAQEDAHVVRKVKEAGAIPLLVSNTPEMCMFWETYNNVTGITRNPYNTRKTPGGSSGGEAALLGSGSSLLSLASDIGGSGRLPAMFCGVFGHKPSPGWVSAVGHMPDCTDKNWNNFFTISPMTRYAEDLLLLLKVISQSPTFIQRLEQKVSMKDLKFFYMEGDGGSGITKKINSDMKSAIRKLKEYLEDTYKIQVKKADIPDLKYGLEVATTTLLELDGADTIFSKEGCDPSEWRSVFVEGIMQMFGCSSHTLYNLCYGILKRTSQSAPHRFVKKMIEINDSLKNQFQELLGENGILIYPTFPIPAHNFYEFYFNIINVSYMMIFNSIGFPVTQCPIGFDRNNMPIGLQIIASPNCDHLCLAVAREIQSAFGGWKPVDSKNLV